MIFLSISIKLLSHILDGINSSKIHTCTELDTENEQLLPKRFLLRLHLDLQLIYFLTDQSLLQ